ncbi:helix-turn-helix domain-containing protein [Kitasatospora sp. NPDC088779]|uniref:helix-turn-helix domain-containing protein n=1 Tax=Kitasatospora sp. NPDC088779 TaxID=3154964 RepID=UPI00341FAB75
MLARRKYRLELSVEQAVLAETFGSICRAVWNVGLAGVPASRPVERLRRSVLADGGAEGRLPLVRRGTVAHSSADPSGSGGCLPSTRPVPGSVALAAALGAVDALLGRQAAPGGAGSPATWAG